MGIYHTISSSTLLIKTQFLFFIVYCYLNHYTIYFGLVFFYTPKARVYSRLVIDSLIYPIDAHNQQTTVPYESIFILYPRVVNWTYFITSVLLLAASLFAGCFDFINNKKQGCHSNCSLLFVALAVPGLASLGNLDGSNNVFFMVYLHL